MTWLVNHEDCCSKLKKKHCDKLDGVSKRERERRERKKWNSWFQDPFENVSFATTFSLAFFSSPRNQFHVNSNGHEKELKRVFGIHDKHPQWKEKGNFLQHSSQFPSSILLRLSSRFSFCTCCTFLTHFHLSLLSSLLTPSRCVFEVWMHKIQKGRGKSKADTTRKKS